MRRPLAFSFVVLAAASAIGACTLLVPSELALCQRDDECVARGGAFARSRCERGVCVASGADSGAGDAATTDAGDAGDTADVGPWGCVGHVSWPLDSSGVTVQMKARIVSTSEGPVTGVNVRACGKLNVACQSPVATATTDANGIFTIKLARGFDGYLELDGGANYLPGVSYFAPVYADRDSTGEEPYHLFAVGDLDVLLAVIGKPIDATAGHIFAIATDCIEAPAAGVSLATSVRGPDTVGYYFKGTLPDPTTLATDGTGLGGFVNVPAGSVLVTARNALGQLYAQRTVLVRAGSITYLQVVPSP